MSFLIIFSGRPPSSIKQNNNMSKNSFPKVLVVSNNSFSKTSSNGRTLGNLFVGWNKDCLAQLCISTDGANFDICNNYYCISDREMLSAFCHLKKAKGQRLIYATETRISTGVGGRPKTAFTATVRHILWSCNRWKSKDLVKWIEEFNPEVVLVQNGDAAFILKIALSISRDRNIPLMMFNTEGNCLFQHDWMRRGLFSFVFFPIYRCILRRTTNKVMHNLKYIVHGNQLLKEDFDKAYGVPSEVVYTGSDVKWSNHAYDSNNPKIVYLGNFGFNRPATLAMVAKTIQTIKAGLKVDVYGTPRNKQQEYILTHTDGIAFHGSVSYGEVKRIMCDADILLHVEGLDDNLQESLKYGFSTKIADSISSGRPFLLVSRPDIACAKYIIETGAGWYVSNQDELLEAVKEILFDTSKREEHLRVALSISEKNHDIITNRSRFFKIIQKICLN